MKRRDFVKTAAASACSVFLPDSIKASAPCEKMIWATFAEISGNCGCHKDWLTKVTCADAVWRRFTDDAAASGANAVVIRIGDGMVFPSHPELAIEGSWSVAKMKAELKRLRGIGLEPIPKLNFSAAHDNWLHDYNFMVSSKTYLSVVSDLIRDTCEIFDGPRLFHIGMDEERYDLQQGYRTAVVRSWQDQWWDDLLHMVAQCEKNGARAWMWSDFGWHHYDCFFKRMPKSVVQSNWYYGRDFTYDPTFNSAMANLAKPSDNVKLRTKFYVDLAKAGYDQIPCGSNWLVSNDAWEVNFPRTVKFCSEHIPAERLKGFLMAPWFGTTEENSAKLMESNRILREAKKLYVRNA
ncbi:MAG: Tat pathway signal protein [Lentisphaerae bacterium]|nr:Tat pathway signal protein [Lentisphaerota bacterium]